jgi:hypothetical protein
VIWISTEITSVKSKESCQVAWKWSPEIGISAPEMNLYPLCPKIFDRLWTKNLSSKLWW